MVQGGPQNSLAGQERWQQNIGATMPLARLTPRSGQGGRCLSQKGTWLLRRSRSLAGKGTRSQNNLDTMPHTYLSTRARPILSNTPALLSLPAASWTGTKSASTTTTNSSSPMPGSEARSGTPLIPKGSQTLQPPGSLPCLPVVSQ